MSTHTSITGSSIINYNTLEARNNGYPDRTITQVAGKRPVDITLMARNMSIAKGFMDISLLSANGNQLRHLLLLGDSESRVYYVLFTGLLMSIVVQISVGIMLLVKERFDLKWEEDQIKAELFNNITVALVFLTLALNVLISSFGVDVLKHNDPQLPVHFKPNFQYGSLINNTIGNDIVR